MSDRSSPPSSSAFSAARSADRGSEDSYRDSKRDIVFLESLSPSNNDEEGAVVAVQSSISRPSHSHHNNKNNNNNNEQQIASSNSSARRRDEQFDTNNTTFYVLDTVAGRRYSLTLPTQSLPRLTLKRLKHIIVQAAAREHALLPPQSTAKHPVLVSDSFHLLFNGKRLADGKRSAAELGIMNYSALTVNRYVRVRHLHSTTADSCTEGAVKKSQQGSSTAQSVSTASSAFMIHTNNNNNNNSHSSNGERLSTRSSAQPLALSSMDGGSSREHSQSILLPAHSSSSRSNDKRSASPVRLAESGSSSERRIVKSRSSKAHSDDTSGRSDGAAALETSEREVSKVLTLEAATAPATPTVSVGAVVVMVEEEEGEGDGADHRSGEAHNAAREEILPDDSSISVLTEDTPSFEPLDEQGSNTNTNNSNTNGGSRSTSERQRTPQFSLMIATPKDEEEEEEAEGEHHCAEEGDDHNNCYVVSQATSERGTVGVRGVEEDEDEDDADNDACTTHDVLHNYARFLEVEHLLDSGVAFLDDFDDGEDDDGVDLGSLMMGNGLGRNHPLRDSGEELVLDEMVSSASSEGMGAGIGNYHSHHHNNNNNVQQQSPPPVAPTTAKAAAVVVCSHNTADMRELLANLCEDVKDLSAQRTSDATRIEALQASLCALQEEKQQLVASQKRVQDQLDTYANSVRAKLNHKSGGEAALTQEEARQLITNMACEHENIELRQRNAALQQQVAAERRQRIELHAWTEDCVKGRLRVMLRVRPPLRSLVNRGINSNNSSSAAVSGKDLKDVYVLTADRHGHLLALEHASPSSKFSQTHAFKPYRVLFDSNVSALKASGASGGVGFASAATTAPTASRRHVGTINTGSIALGSGVVPHTYETTESASSQAHVYTEVQPLVQALVDGSTSTVISVGQVNSGKTYTLFGDTHSPVSSSSSSSSNSLSDEAGLIPRSLETLFTSLSMIRSTRKTHTAATTGEDDTAGGADEEDCLYEVKLSMVDLYLDKIRDLLAPPEASYVLREFSVDPSSAATANGVNSNSSSAVMFEPVSIKGRPDIVGIRYEPPTCVLKSTTSSAAGGSKGGGGGGGCSSTELVGLTTHTVNDLKCALQILEQGRSRRSPQCRSHVIVSIYLTAHKKKKNNNNNTSGTAVKHRTSKMVFVDLAGADRSGAEYDHNRLKESQYINKSLSALNEVLSALHNNNNNNTSKNPNSAAASPIAQATGGRSAAASNRNTNNTTSASAVGKSSASNNNNNTNTSSSSISGNAYIPYRSHKLTLLLQDCLQPQLTCVLLACIAVRDDLMIDTTESSSHLLLAAMNKLKQQHVTASPTTTASTSPPRHSNANLQYFYDMYSSEGYGAWLTASETLSTINFVSRIKRTAHHSEAVAQFLERK